ncbi:MAG: DUF362 domain-containing protein [Candidatus Omnitrophota bacterium]|nr:DUF362 domain-containing protein [Candidatus Omnitrophota bacterium]
MPSNVYLTRLDSSEKDEAINKKIENLVKRSGVLNFIKKDSYTGIKIHFGESGNTGHIKSDWLKSLVSNVQSRTKNIFFTDTNVLYKESERTNAVDHLKLSYKHGFGFDKMGVPVIIADGVWGRNFVEVEINKKRFSKVKIASDIADCDSLLALTHITGHIMTGFAGAIKNLGMGCASRRGKFEQHCGIVPDFNIEHCVGCGLCVANCPAGCISLEAGKARLDETRCIGCGECVVVCKTDALTTKWSETLANLQEKMVEYAYGAVEILDRKLGYINFLTNITGDCDCLAKDEPRITHDIGILASDDLVSIDKASADLLNNMGKQDIFRARHSEIDWTVQLKYANELGLGNLDYKLIEVDD